MTLNDVCVRGRVTWPTPVSSFSSSVNLDCPVDLRFSRKPWIFVLSESNLASLNDNSHATHTDILRGTATVVKAKLGFGYG